MNRVEIESLIKSFLLFFISIALLVGTILYMQYKQDIKSMEDNTFNAMKLCSFDLKCKDLKIDFIPKAKELQLYTLYKTDNTLYSYFSISGSENFLLKFTLDQKSYLQKLHTIQNNFFINISLTLFIVLLLSAIFSFYALSPLRKAFLFTQELIKDILHDFNTPIASLRLNASMLKKEIEPNAKLHRIEQSVESILNLQSNLKAYLLGSVEQKENFVLKELVTQRVEPLQKLFEGITFHIDMSSQTVICNKEAFTRILDNLLSNAAKYNKPNGSVQISLQDDILQIKDTGIGIKEPKRAFERFYKEHERGMGIGLHIVKKLCDELGIDISIQSEMDKGTLISLDLKKC